MDPRSAVINYSKYLLEVEKTEILDYDTIYWFNINDRKAQKGPPTTPDGVDNNGFDNDKNEYITDEGCHIAFRFEITARLGKGSFGQVFKAFDHKLQEFTELKILLLSDSSTPLILISLNFKNSNLFIFLLFIEPINKSKKIYMKIFLPICRGIF